MINYKKVKKLVQEGDKMLRLYKNNDPLLMTTNDEHFMKTFIQDLISSNSRKMNKNLKKQVEMIEKYGNYNVFFNCCTDEEHEEYIKLDKEIELLINTTYGYK